MLDEGYEVSFTYSVGDTGLVGNFDTSAEAVSAAKKYMRGHGLTGRYFINGIVDGVIYPKYSVENDFYGS